MNKKLKKLGFMSWLLLILSRYIHGWIRAHSFLPVFPGDMIKGYVIEMLEQRGYVFIIRRFKPDGKSAVGGDFRGYRDHSDVKTAFCQELLGGDGVMSVVKSDNTVNFQ